MSNSVDSYDHYEAMSPPDFDIASFIMYEENQQGQNFGGNAVSSNGWPNTFHDNQAVGYHQFATGGEQFNTGDWNPPCQSGYPDMQAIPYSYPPPTPPDPDLWPTLESPTTSYFPPTPPESLYHNDNDSNPESPPTPDNSATHPRPQVAKFLFKMLEGPGKDQSLVTWYDKKCGIFRVVNSRLLAQRWGLQKNRPNMTFAKMARGIRERRKAGDFVPLTGEEARRLPRRLIFKFGMKILQQ